MQTQINPRYDPPGNPWWKKVLGIVGGLAGAAAGGLGLAGLAGGAIGAAASGGAGAAAAKGLGAAAGLTGLASGLAPAKGGYVNPTVPATPSITGAPKITGIIPSANVAGGSSKLDKLQTGLQAIGGLMDVSSKLKETVDLATRRPDVGSAIVREAQDLVGQQHYIDQLGGKENADYFQDLMNQTNELLRKRMSPTQPFERPTMSPLSPWKRG